MIGMHVIIIGSGVAGQTAAETLRKNDAEIEITMISRENHPYYPRIFLPDYVANEKELPEIYMRTLDWYDANNINFIKNTEVTEH